jgi:hypothetical protein
MDYCGDVLYYIGKSTAIKLIKEFEQMHILRPHAGLLFVAAIIVSVGLACGGNSATNTATTAENKASNSAKSTPAPAAPNNIAGKYDATGSNPDGAGTYNADLTVTPHDDVYQFSWVSGKTSYDGVGVMTDDAVAVSYTDGDNGKGCGVVLYKIGADGSLDGKSGYWGVNKAEHEKAVRTSGTDLEGKYDVSGTNTDGKDYKGTLEITKDGLGYKFRWNAGTQLEGFGIKANKLVAVGFGGIQCSFVGYDVGSDGTLNGKWGGSQNSSALGTEIAKKK